LVEHYLWPERARDALRVRLSEALRLLADLARGRTGDGKEVMAADVDSWRRRISLKLAEVQALIESSKFEFDARAVEGLQERAGDAQVVFVLLLSLARQRGEARLLAAAQTKALEVDSAVARTLEALAARAASGFTPATPDLERALDALQDRIEGIGISPAAGL